MVALVQSITENKELSLTCIQFTLYLLQI